MNTPQWFAPKGIEEETNVYFMARAEFKTATIPEHLTVKIAAESWYRLWCNNIEVATGPARGTKTVIFFDTLDLTPFLKVGENKLEVLAGSANIPTFKIAPLRPAIWIELENTSLSWQVARDNSFDPNSSKFNFQTGFCEWRDLRVNVFDWHEPEYFPLSKVLLPRDCAPLKVSTHLPALTTFPLSLKANDKYVFDFTREIIGGAELEIMAQEGTQIEFGYGEHLTNGLVNIHVPDKIHTYADRFITLKGNQKVGATLQERGFRFLQISTSKPLIIKMVRAIDRRYPLPPPNFHCEEEPFNRLYRMAHHTVSSCSTDVITDCPWREQALWMNDLVVNAAFWLEAGGDPQLVARCINLALTELNEDGLIYGVLPNGDREEIVFLATNAFLPLILLDLARYDETLTYSLLPQVNDIMKSLEKFTDADGLLVGPEKYWNFLDWSFEFLQKNFFAGQVSASINGFYVLALDGIAKLNQQAGLEYCYWQQRADEVAQKVHTRFWSEKHQYYLEFEEEERCSELAQALACLANRDDNITRILCEKLAQDKNELFKPELCMMHFVIRALIENGYHDAAKARLLRYWGAMLAADSPTLWEVNVHQHGSAAFRGAGSLCHIFSCSPLWALPRLYPSAMSP